MKLQQSIFIKCVWVALVRSSRHRYGKKITYHLNKHVFRHTNEMKRNNAWHGRANAAERDGEAANDKWTTTTTALKNNKYTHGMEWQEEHACIKHINNNNNVRITCASIKCSLISWNKVIYSTKEFRVWASERSDRTTEINQRTQNINTHTHTHAQRTEHCERYA